MKIRLAWLSTAGAVMVWMSASATPVQAAAPGAMPEDEEDVVTGSRRAARSGGESPVPVDVFSGDDFVNQGNADMNSMLSTLVPSYNVNPQPISDAATIMRPANLRGLPPDNTLILVNGK